MELMFFEQLKLLFLLLDYKITNLPLIDYLVAKLGLNASLHVQKDTNETIKLFKVPTFKSYGIKEFQHNCLYDWKYDYFMNIINK